MIIVYRKTDDLELDCCSIIRKRMLRDVLILVMWPKWVHKHLLEVAEMYSAGNNQHRYLDLLTEIFYTNFEDEDFNQLHW